MNPPATVPIGLDEPSVTLAQVVAHADGESSQVLAQARQDRESARRALAEAEEAVTAAEGAARRQLETTVGAWCEAEAQRGVDTLDRAAAVTIAAELEEVSSNREVVLDTIHPSLHGEISQAFDRRIAELETRAQDHRSLGDDAEPPGPVVVGAAWVREDPPAIGVVVLDLGVDGLMDGVREALAGVVARQGGGEVQAVDGLSRASYLVADVESATIGSAEVARILGEQIDERVRGAEGWPIVARALVQPLQGAAARAVSETLPPRG